MNARDVKKAVVLAAGFGTRLRPLTLVEPKPLLPMWGVPMLERIILMLESWGVEEIAVNAHWQAEKIREYVFKRRGTAKVTVADEPEILGTGGVLNPLRGFLGAEPFWLVNGDIVVDGLDPQSVADAYSLSGGFAGCWISEAFGPRTVEADYAGRICNWKSDFPGDGGTYTYCGLALLGPQVLDFVAPQGFSTIVQAYERAMMEQGRFVVGADPDGAYWADCGTLESYLEAHSALDSARFEENPNVLFPGVKLLDSADLAGCVVTGGLVGGAFERAALVGVGQIGNARLAALAEAIGWNPEDVAAEFMGARGSDREFWRFVHGDDRAIAILYDDEKRPENARYAHHARLLEKAGVPVPRVLADLPGEKALALEDLGGESLEERASAKGANIAKLYAPVVSALRTFHERGVELALEESADALEPAFGPDLYAWERDLFETYCVKGRYGYDAMPEAVRADLEAVAAELMRQRPVLVHRDFQSSNVLFRPGGSFAFIDFQGMRLGAAAYDLASLLYDPYVPMDEKTRLALARAYPVPAFAFGAVQRLVQALGAFGRLEAAGQPQFARHVPRALENLLAAADEAGLDALGGFAEDLIAKEQIRLGRMHHAHHHEDDEEA
ncbi:MAG: phosphotransferase [Kiritimatiellae bacterium]|nr:phosphotransferase [Kiritimatiellia bacterium]